MGNCNSKLPCGLQEATRLHRRKQRTQATRPVIIPASIFGFALALGPFATTATGQAVNAKPNQTTQKHGFQKPEQAVPKLFSEGEAALRAGKLDDSEKAFRDVLKR